LETQARSLSKARPVTVADLIPLPLQGLARDAVLVVGFSLLTALCAQIVIPLDPVPITFQTLAVLLSGATLGYKRGAAAMLLYVLEGAVGLPFYAQGKHGFDVLFGATGGYLFGFVLAATLVGWLAERGWDHNYFKTTLAMVLGSLLFYTLGVLSVWLVAYHGTQFDAALQNGFVKFIPLDIAKILVAASVLPSTWSLTQRNRSK
jgi:biotin transport system substrate-specific component